jgi:serine/threonine protein kinase
MKSACTNSLRTYAVIRAFSLFLSLPPYLDIWSCGVILYQMFSLLVDVPFDPIDLVLNPSKRVPPLSQYAVTTPLSPAMHAIVMRALEVDREKRFASAEEMGDALHAEERRIVDKQRSMIHAPNAAAKEEPAQTPAAVKRAASRAASTPTEDSSFDVPPPAEVAFAPPAPADARANRHHRPQPRRRGTPFAPSATDEQLPSKL